MAALRAVTFFALATLTLKVHGFRRLAGGHMGIEKVEEEMKALTERVEQLESLRGRLIKLESQVQASQSPGIQVPRAVPSHVEPHVAKPEGPPVPQRGVDMNELKDAIKKRRPLAGEGALLQETSPGSRIEKLIEEVKDLTERVERLESLKGRLIKLESAVQASGVQALPGEMKKPVMDMSKLKDELSKRQPRVQGGALLEESSAGSAPPAATPSEESQIGKLIEELNALTERVDRLESLKGRLIKLESAVQASQTPSVQALPGQMKNPAAPPASKPASRPERPSVPLAGMDMNELKDALKKTKNPAAPPASKPASKPERPSAPFAGTNMNELKDTLKKTKNPAAPAASKPASKPERPSAPFAGTNMKELKDALKKTKNPAAPSASKPASMPEWLAIG